MIKRVYKYEVPVMDVVTIQLPIGAEILTVQSQNGIPCIWALIDPVNPYKDRTFRLAGTGHSIEVNNEVKENYIGTFQLENGLLVFHLFELITKGK